MATKLCLTGFVLLSIFSWVYCSCKPVPKIKKVVDSVELGEGPHWDAKTRSLYFVDIYGRAIHKYVPETKKHTWAVIAGTRNVSLIVPVEGETDKFLISIGRDLTIVTWNGESNEVSDLRKIYEIDNSPDTLDNRFNDGKCDDTGRLWAGSQAPRDATGYIAPGKASLISLGPNEQVKIQLTKVGISNGLTWSLDNKYFYYIDTLKGTVDQYDFDIENAVISNPKPVFTIEKSKIPGRLDGMTRDTDGNLWIAINRGSRVIQIDPRRPETVLRQIKVPAFQVTSVAFGGPNLDQLFVTSARVPINGTEYRPPYNGATYVITGTGAKGFPGIRFKL